MAQKFRRIMAGGLLFAGSTIGAHSTAEAAVIRPPDAIDRPAGNTRADIPCGLDPTQNAGAELLPLILARAGMDCVDVPARIVDEYPGSMFVTVDNQTATIFYNVSDYEGNPAVQAVMSGSIADLTDTEIMLARSPNADVLYSNRVAHLDTCAPRFALVGERDLRQLGAVLMFMGDQIQNPCL